MTSAKHIVAVVCGDAGGAAATAPVARELHLNGTVSLRMFAYGQASDLWARRGLRFETLDADISLKNIVHTLQSSPVSLVFTGTSVNCVMLENRFVKAAWIASIPSLAIVDYWSNYTERFRDFDEGVICLPDYIAVMDEQAKDEMAQEGIDPFRLIVTGQPAFDQLVRMRTQFTDADRREVRAILGIEGDALLIFFVSQPLSEFYGSSSLANPRYLGFTERVVLRELIVALEKIADKTEKSIVLVVRPHPREDRKWLTGVRGNKIHIVVSDIGDSRNLTMAADLVAGMNSILLVESCYLGCVTVSLQPGLCGKDTLPTNRAGLSHPVYRKEKILPAIERLLLDEEVRMTLQERLTAFVPIPGAARRVSSLILQLLENSVCAS